MSNDRPLTISRRHFLIAGSACAAGLLPGVKLLAQDQPAPVDQNLFVLLADTHVSQNHDEVVYGTNIADNFRRMAEQVSQMNPRPAGIILCGDAARLQGLPGDYAYLAELLQPIQTAGIPVHVAMGNHDSRDEYLKAFPAAAEKPSPVEEKHVLVLNTPEADLYVLDSLERTNVTPGVLGEKQIQWLAESLDRAPERPAMIFLHHPPQLEPVNNINNNLTDTKALYDVIAPRKQVKAYVFGHSHRWSLAEYEGIHLVNLAALAYVFNKELFNGWAEMRIQPGRASLTIRTIDPQREENGKTIDLDWR